MAMWGKDVGIMEKNCGEQTVFPTTCLTCSSGQRSRFSERVPGRDDGELW